MTEICKKLKMVQKGYANFLHEQVLALPMHQTVVGIIFWGGFLLFAEEYGGCTFDQTLNLFLAARR